ncbi:MAG: class I SAM-dependent methyltransferase [Saprospiraceae bacterium]
MDNKELNFTTWNKVAQLYQDNFMDLKQYNESYKFFCDQISDRKAKILDIGCGPGNISKYLIINKPDLQIIGIDFSPNMIELARTNIPQSRLEVLDCREVLRINQIFNGIICGFCIPYLSKEDLEKFISDCYSLLLPKGMAYFSYIEGEYTHSKIETGRSGDTCIVYYYHKSYFDQLLKHNGFEIIGSFQLQYTNSENEKSVQQITISYKIETT